jgi:hypothetical protein
MLPLSRVFVVSAQRVACASETLTGAFALIAVVPCGLAVLLTFLLTISRVSVHSISGSYVSGTTDSPC